MKTNLLLAFFLLIGNPCIAQTLTLNPVNEPFHRDLSQVLSFYPNYLEYILPPYEYTTSNLVITRSGVIFRKQNNSTGEVKIKGKIELRGNNIVLDGLTWYGDVFSNNINRSSDPGTVSIGGKFNRLANCSFKNFKVNSEDHSIIILVGKTSSLYTDASGTVVENCSFDNWGCVGAGTCGCISLSRDRFSPDTRVGFYGVILRNNTFTNGPNSGGFNSAIKVFDAVTDVLIENNTIENASEVFEIKSSNVTVRGNSIRNCTGYNILANRGGYNNLFEGNLVENIPASTSAIMIWKGGNIIYRNNIIKNCGYLARINSMESVAHSPLTNVLIINNTFYNIARGFYFEAYAGSNAPNPPVYPINFNIVNNIFQGTSPINIGLDGSQGFVYNGTVTKNLFFQMVPYGTNTIISNPMFSDSNLRLAVGSPAIDSGSDWNGTVFIDKDFVIRPVDGDNNGSRAYDIGAFEYISPTIPQVICVGGQNLTLDSELLTGLYSPYLNVVALNQSTVSTSTYTKLEYYNSVDFYPNFEIPYGADFEVAPKSSTCTHLYPLFANTGRYGANNTRQASVDEMPKSNLEQIDFSLNKEFVVYPNPSEGLFSAGLVGAGNGEKPLEIAVYSLNGALIYTNDSPDSASGIFHDLQISNKGLFLVELKTTKKYFRKLLLVK